MQIDNNEIKQYINACYVSSLEAFTQIFGWSTHKVCTLNSFFFLCLTFSFVQEYPSVVQLPVHLRDEQFVVFNSSTSTLDQLEQDMKDTKLTTCFDANRVFPKVHQLLYMDMLSKFVWDREAHKWKLRKKGWAFSHISFIPLNTGKKFYARLILSITKHLQSFDNLQTVNGVLYPSIRDACYTWGLLEDGDTLWMTWRTSRLAPKCALCFWWLWKRTCWHNLCFYGILTSLTSVMTFLGFWTSRGWETSLHPLHMTSGYT